MTKPNVMAAMLITIISLSIPIEVFTQQASIAADVARQIEKLQSGSPKQKVYAIEKLAEMGSNAAPSVPYLIELIDSNEKYESLWEKIWNSMAILNGSYRYVKYESQQALIRIGKPAVEPLSIALLTHQRLRVRENSAIVLGKIKNRESIGPLIIALKRDKCYQVRMWSAEALGKMAETWSIKSLDDAVQALIEALKDSDPNVRQKSAYALGNIKATAAVPALIDALKTYGKDCDAGLALFMITGQRLGDDSQKWREWYEIYQR